VNLPSHITYCPRSIFAGWFRSGKIALSVGFGSVCFAKMALVHFVLREWVWFSSFRTTPLELGCGILATGGREIVRHNAARAFAPAGKLGDA
jgi:hypothetical protein